MKRLVTFKNKQHALDLQTALKKILPSNGTVMVELETVTLYNCDDQKIINSAIMLTAFFEAGINSHRLIIDKANI